MLRLTLFEVRKNYLNKYMISSLLLLIILNIFVIYRDYIKGDINDDHFMTRDESTLNQWNFYEKMHEKLDGELTSEKISFVTREINKLSEIVEQGIYSTEYQEDTYTGYTYGDYYMIKRYFYEPMKYIALYETNISKIVEEAKENVKFYTSVGNAVEKKKNEIVINNYTGRSIDKFYDMKCWERLFNYRFSELISVSLMLLGIGPIFVNERETKMDAMILSSKKGKIAMTYAKVLSIFIFIVFLNIVFATINFFEFKILYGLKGSGLPLYAIEAFQYTPLNCSVGAFYCFNSLLNIIGMFSFGLFISFFSSIFRRVVYTYMLSILFFVLGLYSSGYLASVESKKMLSSLISPFTMLKAEQLYSNLLGCRIANMFYLRASIGIVIQIITIIIIFLMIYFFGTKMEFKVRKRHFRKEVN